MKLTAIFESWLIPDGNYDPFHLEMPVRLAFELQPSVIELAGKRGQEHFKHIEDAKYSYCGTVLKRCDAWNRFADNESVFAVRFGNFNAYVESFPAGAPKLLEGDRVEGEGNVLVDHFIWKETFSQRQDVPNLFYELRVQRIRAVHIPERFITRYEGGNSYPCSLSPGQYDQANIKAVEKMADGEFSFYLVDFQGKNVETKDI